MQESYKEDLANHFGHESYADDGNVAGARCRNYGVLPRRKLPIHMWT